MENQTTKENKQNLSKLLDELKENKQYIKVRDGRGVMVELKKLEKNIAANKSIIMS